MPTSIDGLEEAAREAAAEERAQAEHEARWDYLKTRGWELTPEGLVLDTSDSRWATTSSEVVEYDPALSFEDAVRAAWHRQKRAEAEELRAGRR